MGVLDTGVPRTPRQARAALAEINAPNPLVFESLKGEVGRVIKGLTDPIVQGCIENLNSMNDEAAELAQRATGLVETRLSDLRRKIKRREISAKEARIERDRIRREEMKLTQLLDSITAAHEREVYVRTTPRTHSTRCTRSTARFHVHCSPSDRRRAGAASFTVSLHRLFRPHPNQRRPLMRASPTLPQTADVHSSDFRLALRAVLSLRESHSVAPVPKGNCHAHDLVDRWKQLTGEPMPLHILRQELRIYLHGEAPDYRTECAQQRSADEALAVALLNEDVRLVCRSKRGRR